MLMYPVLRSLTLQLHSAITGSYISGTHSIAFINCLNEQIAKDIARYRGTSPDGFLSSLKWKSKPYSCGTKLSRVSREHLYFPALCTSTQMVFFFSCALLVSLYHISTYQELCFLKESWQLSLKSVLQ